MIASVCLEQKLIQPSLQKTSKDIWGFTCQTPFISEFLLQRRGWHICKQLCSAPSTIPSPPAGSCSSYTLWARRWEVIWVFLQQKGNALQGARSHAFWLSGQLSAVLVALQWSVRLPQCPMPFPRGRAGGGSAWDPYSHGWLWEEVSELGSPPSPPSSIYFPNLVRLPRSSLIGPWKIIAVWKSWAGWNFLFGKLLLAPFPASAPVRGRGCTCASSAGSSPALLTRSPALLCLPVYIAACCPAGSPPASFWGIFFPAYLFSLCKAHASRGNELWLNKTQPATLSSFARQDSCLLLGRNASTVFLARCFLCRRGRLEMWFECCCTALRENVGWQRAVRLAHRHGFFLPALSSEFLLKKKTDMPVPKRKRPLWL